MYIYIYTVRGAVARLYSCKHSARFPAPMSAAHVIEFARVSFVLPAPKDASRSIALKVSRKIRALNASPRKSRASPRQVKPRAWRVRLSTGSLSARRTLIDGRKSTECEEGPCFRTVVERRRLRRTASSRESPRISDRYATERPGGDATGSGLRLPNRAGSFSTRPLNDAVTPSCITN